MNEVSHQPQQNIVLLSLPTRWLQLMLWILVVFDVAIMILGIVFLDVISFGAEPAISDSGILLDYTQTHIPVSQIGGIILLLFLLFSLEFVFSIPAFILLLVWMYRANSNCHRLGAENMRFTPGWAVKWYFVPIANWWKPYQCLNEIWRISKNPSGWQSESDNFLPRLWWALWLFQWYVLIIASLTPLDVNAVVTPMLANTVAQILLCVVEIFIVGAVASNQKKIMERGYIF